MRESDDVQWKGIREREERLKEQKNKRGNTRDDDEGMLLAHERGIRGRIRGGDDDK